MKYFTKTLYLIFTLILLFSTTNGISAEEEIDLSITSPQTATIKTRLINNSNTSLEGVEFLCNESNNLGNIVNSFTFRTNSSGTFVWEPIVNTGSIYSCNATSGFPDCYIPASSSHQAFTIRDLVAGEVRNNTLLWVFDSSQPHKGGTCADILNPKEPGEIPSEISLISIPSEYAISPFLGNLSKQEAESVRNLTITYVGSESSFACSYLFANNSVQWLRNVNLNDPQVINFFRNLSNNITLDSKGSVRVNVQDIEQLNRRRRIHLNNLNLNSRNTSSPTILIDNVQAYRNTISNISYTDSTLSFVVESGTNYVFLPTINVNECSPRNRRNGECIFNGNVDALCSSLVLEVNDNDNTQSYEVPLNSDGSFEYKVSNLNSDSNYKFKLVAKVHNDRSNYYEWELSDLSSIFSNSILLFISIIFIVILITYFIKKKNNKKEILERKNTLNSNIEKLVENINSFTQEIKERYKIIDLDNDKHVDKVMEILKLNESVEELKDSVQEAEREEVEQSITFPIDYMEEIYLELHSRFEDYKKDLIEKAAINTISSQQRKESKRKIK